ncbi:hypothetical protein [Chitinophaga eiseniae]|uniref:Uncharacterized protein n=1 Tax=Chitinophaga eiseniae TaxID=634771 RepID=A0A847SLB7_9BACT|nr:hypothetical protein [Chitinophaga eiseniae]NLR78388.1 hypothetical protein [Chitinophaga eiseniae]
MKWLVYLFSLYVLLLTGVPCEADDDCCSNFTALTEHQESGTGKNHKPVSPCSPFFACGAIHAIVVPEPYRAKPLLLQPVTNTHSDYIEPALRDFPPSIWQPPKQAYTIQF